MLQRIAMDHVEQAWYDAQARVRNWLRICHGIHCISAGYYAPFDLLTSDGIRIEVKYSPYRDLGGRKLGKKAWVFNIHRHGLVAEGQVDAYVLRCARAPEVGIGAAIHLILPAPVRKATICITPRSLLTRYAQFFNRVDYLQLKPGESKRVVEIDPRPANLATGRRQAIQEALRHASMSQTEIAEEFGVSRQRVWQISKTMSAEATVGQD